MGKKVTFGIEFANVSNVEDVIKKNLDNYKLHIVNDQKEQAVQLVIDTTEMVLFEDPVVLHHLPTMIKYCQKAIKLLKDDQDNMFIPRIYTNMSQCYLKLDEYPLAIKHGLLTIDIYKRDEQPSNRSNLQAIYKQLGDIYFTKSLNQDECRHDDFDNALQFYKLEREVIDTMDLSDIEDSEPNDLLKLTQASHLNMGVMESKISAFEAAIENIKQAVAIAIQLNDFVAEKTAWWELGNLYKRMNQLNNVLFCQGKEYRIVKRHGLRDDEFYCFEEQFIYLIFMSEFDQCFQIYEDTIRDLDQKYKKRCEELYEIAVQVKSLQADLNNSINDNYSNATIAESFLQHIQFLSEHGSYRLIIKSVDTGLSSIVEAVDYSHCLHAQLLFYKAEALWNLKESRKAAYIAAFNEVLEFIDAVAVSKLDKLQLTITVYKFFIKIYTYFGNQSEINHYKELLTLKRTEEQIVRAKLPKDSLTDDEGDHEGDQSRITPVNIKIESGTIHVNIKIEPVPVHFSIYYAAFPELVETVINDVQLKCEEDYGVKIVISHIETNDRDAFPEDVLADVVTEDNQAMEAIVRRIIYKSPLEVYQYVITKANISPSEMLEEILEEQSKTELLLKYLMISDYIDIFQQVFQLSGVLSILNLSSNFLDDEDLSELLYNSSKSITELDLSGNLLTADCLDSIMGFSKLRKLILSNNPLGPVILQRLPELLTKIPSILDIDLSDTNLGEETPFDTAISEAYINYRITAPMDSGLTIRISDNHFTKDTLCHWTPLWKNLKQVSCLQLSSISSETAWENFDMLLELPKLSKLILNRSTRTSLDLCDLKQLFKIKSSFDHLDLANCSLTGEDTKLLASYFNESLIKVQKLTLHSNPKIGDKGIHFLNEAVLGSKIDVLDISDCGVTYNSHQRIVEWSAHFVEIDLTRNPYLFDATQEENEWFVTNLSRTAFVKLDDYKNALPKEAIPNHCGVSFRHVSTLPRTPFD